MKFVSAQNPSNNFDPRKQYPSDENGLEFQRLLKVFSVVEDAVHQGSFTSLHTVNIADIRILEDRFFGKDNGRYMGLESSIKGVRNDGASDIIMVLNGLVTIIDHFRFDCTRWTKKGSPLFRLLSTGDRSRQNPPLENTDFLSFCKNRALVILKQIGLQI